jgi:FlaA1/EpsC-like NDP-sugar epimerase
MQINRARTAGSNSVPRPPIRWKAIFVVVLDLFVWWVMFAVASLGIGIRPVLLATVAMSTHLVVGLLIGLYRERYQPISFEEMGALAISATAAGGAALAVHLVIAPERYMRSIALAATATLLLQYFHRYARRFRARVVQRQRGRVTSMPVLVIGAGEGGLRAIRTMHMDRNQAYLPLAILDDDPTQWNRRIEGVRVAGSVQQLGDIARRHRVRGVVVAIPSASNATLARLATQIRNHGLEPFVTPPVQRLLGVGTAAEITRVNDESLMRRQVVDIDVDSVRSYLTGRSILVTGAGGSIGSELARQILAFGPRQLICLDHDDSALHALRGSFADHHLDVIVTTLADIRDGDRLDDVFARHRPELVFHAAALKHLPALERDPGEGWKTNVLGTANVLAACEAFGVEQAVNISTDKAADPVSVLGYTKRIAERLTAAAAASTRRRFVSVRFGNVIGSRGAVLETFERQLAEGGPLTVTHPEVSRYFMAIREAVRLTLQAAVIGRGGEVLVLDMGEPVRIADVARQMIEQSGDPIDIRYVGLRHGEKLHEQLLGDGEVAERPLHPMIDHVPVPALDLAQLRGFVSSHGLDVDDSEALRTLMGLGAPMPADPREDANDGEGPPEQSNVG